MSHLQVAAGLVVPRRALRGVASHSDAGGHEGRDDLRRGFGVIALLVASAAFAHVPSVAGRLVDCIRRSDVVVAGVVERVVDVDAVTVEATVRVEKVLYGTALQEKVSFRGGARFATGRRYVVFLHREGDVLSGVQPSGTYFPSMPNDDALYQQINTGVRAALAAPGDTVIEPLRAALIPGLRAGPPELRISVALELGAFAHHPLSAAQRAQLDAIVAEPGVDPTLRKLIELTTRNQ